VLCRQRLAIGCRLLLVKFVISVGLFLAIALAAE
jgi:hypothetical protein